MGGLQGCKDAILKDAVNIPAEVLALLTKVFEGRERVRDEYFHDEQPGEQSMVSHQHHCDELRRMHADLSAFKPRATVQEILSLPSWRRASA